MIAMTPATATFWLIVGIIFGIVAHIRAVRRSKREERLYGHRWRQLDDAWRDYQSRR